MALMAIFDSSPVFLTAFTKFLLVSSVNSGTTNLITLPSFEGFIPRSEVNIAFQFL